MAEQDREMKLKITTVISLVTLIVGGSLALFAYAQNNTSSIKVLRERINTQERMQSLIRSDLKEVLKTVNKMNLTMSKICSEFEYLKDKDD